MAYVLGTAVLMELYLIFSAEMWAGSGQPGATSTCQNELGGLIFYLHEAGKDVPSQNRGWRGRYPIGPQPGVERARVAHETHLYCHG
jgi:hypothetical protein